MGKIGLVSLCFFALFLVSAEAAGAAEIRGEVVNGSGTEFREPVEVSLIAFGEASGEWSDDDGRDGFLFQDLPAGAGSRFLLQVTYLGIVYNSQFRVHADTAMTIAVYDTTSVLSGIMLEEMEIDLKRTGGRLHVDQIYRVINASDPPVTFVGDGGTFRITLPLPAEETENLLLAASRGIVPVRRDPLLTGRSGEVALDYPLRPGFTAAAASFDLHYPDAFDYELLLAYDVPRILIVAPPDMSVTGDRVSPAHIGGQAAGVYMIEGGAAAGETVLFRAEGGSDAPPEERSGERPTGRVHVGVPPFFDVQILVIGFLILVLFAGLLIAFLMKRGKKS